MKDQKILIIYDPRQSRKTTLLQMLAEAELLRELSDSYLYKDILTWERIQKPEKLERLVRALALQLGSEVSYNELGRTCGIDNETVEKYISLLEKAFIVFRLPSFSRNLKKSTSGQRSRVP